MNYPILNRILSSSLADIDKNVLKKALKELGKRSHQFMAVDGFTGEPLTEESSPFLELSKLEPFSLALADLCDLDWIGEGSRLRHELNKKLQHFFSRKVDSFIDDREPHALGVTVSFDLSEKDLEEFGDLEEPDNLFLLIAPYNEERDYQVETDVSIFHNIQEHLEDPTDELSEDAEKYIRDYMAGKKDS